MTPWTVATRFHCPWNSLGKHIGVGCHSLLQGNVSKSGLESGSLASQADSLPSEPPREAQCGKELKMIRENHRIRGVRQETKCVHACQVASVMSDSL